MTPAERLERVMMDVIAERMRQDEKWGEQNHDSTVWITVLSEEVGELAQAALDRRLWLAPSTHHVDVKRREAAHQLQRMRDEAIQCAAVAMAIVEWIDRRCPIDATQIDERLS